MDGIVFKWEVQKCVSPRPASPSWYIHLYSYSCILYIMSDVEWLFQFSLLVLLSAATGPPSDAGHSVHSCRFEKNNTTARMDGTCLLESRERDVFVSHSWNCLAYYERVRCSIIQRVALLLLSLLLRLSVGSIVCGSSYSSLRWQKSRRNDDDDDEWQDFTFCRMRVNGDRPTKVGRQFSFKYPPAMRLAIFFFFTLENERKNRVKVLFFISTFFK